METKVKQVESDCGYLPAEMIPEGQGLVVNILASAGIILPPVGRWFRVASDGHIPGVHALGYDHSPDVPVKAGTTVRLARARTPGRRAIWEIAD